MTETSDSKQWQDQGENMGLDEETARIELYCNYRDKQTWKQEADKQRYSSLSKYLYDMIQEGRATRHEGTQPPEGTADRIQELEAENERLKQQVADDESETLDPSLVDADLVAALLTEQYQPVEELLDQLTENDELQTTLKNPVTDALYDLADDDRAEYERGWGWRLGGAQ